MTTQLDRAEYGPGERRSPYERGTDGPRVVLVGVDGSRTSLRAAAYAAGLARRQRSRLVVVYVATPSALNIMADLVVVGSSEGTGHRLIGSIADRLVRCGRWPVIVVP